MYDFICENGRVEESGLDAFLNSKAQSGMISYRQYTTGYSAMNSAAQSMMQYIFLRYGCSMRTRR